METLWNQPKVIAELITNSNKDDIKNNLGFFFMNNFYENILSSSFIEDNLLHVITLALTDEIKKMKSTKDINTFLEDTSCGYFLEQLNYKMDVINFYKIILVNLVESLENMSSSKKINFNVKQIQDNFLKMKEIMEERLQKTGEKLNIVDNNFFRSNFLSDFERELAKETNDESLTDKAKNSERKKLFNSYIPDLTKEEIEKQISENKGNEGMKEYCSKLIKEYEKDKKVFSNEQFLANVFDSSVGKEVLALYQLDFFKVTKIIDELFNSLLNNIYLIPYSVKCICKILSILIKRRFKTASKLEQNIILSKFFFNKLLLPAFKDPKFGSFINNFIISGATIQNLEIISSIIEKIVSFDFIKSDENNNVDISPFNRYFLEKMPTVLKLFDNLSVVKLPSFIEDVIDNPEKNHVYNYFKENVEEIIFHRSICFSLDDMLSLLNNMDSCKDIIFKDNSTKELKITFEKVFYSNKEIIEEMKNKQEFEILQTGKKKKSKQEIKILNFFLFTKLIINEKYKPIFNLMQDTPNFTIKELKSTKTETEIQKNNIIKVKNLFSGLLYNYRNLVRTDFSEGTTKNTLMILKELKKFMKSSEFLIDGTIPSEWYVNSLFECLKLLPNDLKNNDYENLYNSLMDDLNIAMKELDFETLSFCLGKIKFANRGKLYLDNLAKDIIEIELNKKVQNIIEKAIIPVTISLNIKEKEFKIEKGKSIKEIPFFDIFKDDNDRRVTCPSIESFGKKFPNVEAERIIAYPQIEFYDFDEELNLSDELTNYFNIIREHLTKKMNFDESQKEFELIIDKIYDYIMEKIYDKIYPSAPQISDNVIFTQCILLSWVEPQHLIKGKNNYLFDSFLPDVISYFEKIEKEKSPRKKQENMKNIFTSIENVVKFNGDNNDIGVDDQLPILNYAFIKAHPFPIFTNCKYMELFLGNKKYKIEGNYLTQLFTLCNFIQDLNASNLFDVSEEKFQKNCMNAREMRGFL